MKWNISKKNNSLDSSIDSFRKEIDNVFDDFFTMKPTSFFDSEWLPKLDVEEDEKEFKISAELPGMDEKDINLTLENSMLTISGEKKFEKEEKNDKKKFYHSERHFGKFTRSISLPEDVKVDDVKAMFKKGVLSINIPKDETRKQKRISIKVD